MAELALEAETARPTGTRPSRRLRAEGRIPAVVYGLGREAQSITVEWTALRQVLTTEAGLNALIDLHVDGDRQLSIVKELQQHPVRRDVMHVDFLRIDPDAEIRVEVPISLVGEARKVTDENGMVDQTMFTLTVFSRPDAIPTEFEVDISELTVGDSVRVDDLAMPDGVRTEVDGEEAVAVGTVTRSTIEAIAAEEAAEAEAEADVEGAQAGDVEAEGAGDADSSDADDAGDSADE